MAQPPPRAPLAPMQPLTPRRPSAPMQPLSRLVPLQPLTPLRPGESRSGAARPAPRSQMPATAYPQASQVLPPPPPPVRLQRVVPQLGLAQPPAGTWGGTRPGRPVAVRRPSGGRAAAFIGSAVAVIVALSVVGTFKSSSGGDSFAVSIPSPSFSIPSLSIGGGATGRHQPSRPDAPHPNPRSSRSVSLTGNVEGESIRVTLIRLVNNAKPKDTFMDSPEPGKRLVGVQFRITNTGSVGYVDSPSNGAYVYDTKGRQYRAAFLFESLREGKIFDAAVSLDTGRSAVGFLAFQVPKHARINRVEFSENSGFGQKGEWTIKR